MELRIKVEETSFSIFQDAKLSKTAVNQVCLSRENPKMNTTKGNYIYITIKRLLLLNVLF